MTTGSENNGGEGRELINYLILLIIGFAQPCSDFRRKTGREGLQFPVKGCPFLPADKIGPLAEVQGRESYARKSLWHSFRGPQALHRLQR